MNKNAIDDVLHQGTSAGKDGTPKLPGAVFMVADLKKKSTYSEVSGVRTLDPNGSPKELEADGVCAIYSMTKLMTCVSVMQCVERGQIGLDDDISTLLPTWKDAEVLEGFDDSGKPILRKAKNKITLRLLLCHSSGIGYDSMYPNLMQWRKSRGEEQKTMIGSVEEGYKLPLLFEPGEGWAYGAGIDWAGKLVEAINGGMRLGAYMQKNIWTPLNMTSTTFQIDIPEAAPLKSRLSDMAMRIPTGQLIHIPDPLFARPAADDCGGIGAYSTASDYLKVLLSIVRDDGRLLKTATIDEMFKPQTPNPKYLAKILEDPIMWGLLAGALPKKSKVDYGLGGMLNMEAVPGGRAKGSMQWGGLPNLFWWMDREKGVCATYFTQLVPTGDPAALEMMTNLEQAVYSPLSGKSSQL